VVALCASSVGLVTALKLCVGYIKESFDNVTDANAKARNQKVLDILAAVGISNQTEW
jgi:hypothetical protein